MRMRQAMPWMFLFLATVVWAAQPRAPRALVVEGLWSDTFRIREACHAAGVEPETAFVSQSPFFRPQRLLFDMPERLDLYDVVVLANIDAGVLGSNRLAALVRHVEGGGGLVVLGGYWAYSRGAYAGTRLAALLPVAMPPENRIEQHAPGLILAPDADSGPFSKMDLTAGPRAFVVQTLEPKPGAEVWLKAGDNPAVVAGKAGPGRVIASALTANGEAGPGETAFWDWEMWPTMLGAMIDAAARPAGPAPSTATNAAALTRDEIVRLAMAEEGSGVLARRAIANPAAGSADALLEYAMSAQDRTLGLADALPALIPSAKPEWGAKLAEVAGFSNPDRTSRRAALVLLGATKSPEAAEPLSRALTDKDLRDAAIEGLGWSGDASVIPRLRRAYDEAMLAARKGKAGASLDPEAFARDQARMAAAAAVALYRLGDTRALERVLDIYQQVRLYRLIFRNAGKRRVREADVQGLELLQSIIDGRERLAQTWRKLRLEAGPVPPAQVADVVKVAAAETDPDRVEWLVLALRQSGDALPPESWRALAEAKDGIIRRLARSMEGSPP